MVAVSSHNWLIVLGLVSLLFGLFLLGSAVGSDGARWSSQDRARRGLRGYQLVALSSAMGLLAAGLGCLITGQFVVMTLSTPIVLALLALALGLLVFALVADLIGAWIDEDSTRADGTALVAIISPAELRDIELRAVPERLRIAG